MRYKDENYNLEEYFNKVMEELGFTEGVEKVGGYYRDEAEYNVIADYISSCGLEKKEDMEFINKLGYMPGDFIEGED